MSVIAANTDAPVSVKCRIGVDDHDSYNELCKVLFLYVMFYDYTTSAKFLIFYLFFVSETTY